jgi:3-oxoadipate enol-lactonase
MAGQRALQLPAASGGARLHVLLDGPEGAPVITCLHTLATNADLFDADMARLMRDHRVLRIDFRGHGRSTAGPRQDDPQAAYTLAELAADVVAVWDALEIGTSSVLGLSLGGMIALELGLAHPARVDCLIAAGCRADAPPVFRETWQARRAILAEGGLKAVADVTLPTWLTPAASPEAVAQARRMIEATSVAGYAGATRALEGLDLLPRLPGLTRPALFLVGSNDGAHPAAQREMAAATPGSRFVEIDGPAHLLNLEAPEAFADAALDFFATVNGKVRA